MLIQAYQRAPIATYHLLTSQTERVIYQRVMFNVPIKKILLEEKQCFLRFTNRFYTMNNAHRPTTPLTPLCRVLEGATVEKPQIPPLSRDYHESDR